MIGSSNYGQRSIQRDLENGLVVVTKSLELKRQFQQVEPPSLSLCEKQSQRKNAVCSSCFSFSLSLVDDWARI